MCLSHHHAAFDGPRMAFAEPGVRRHYAPSRAVRITHARIRLVLEPAERTFRGEARFRIEALPTYAGRFAFDLDDVALLAVEDGHGNPLRWVREESQLRVRAETAPTEVVVRWEGAEPRRGLYFTGPTPWAPERQHMAWTQCQDEDAHFLMPCHDHPGVKHPWRIELEAPAGYTLLSNGRCLEQSERDGRSVAVFEQEEPMPAYLFTAVAAKLSVVEATWRGRSVRYLVPVGEEEAVTRSMGKTPLMLEAFSQLTGVEYPWPRYDQVVVHDFIFGGMENVACTTMTDLLLVTPDAIAEWDPDGLVAHELAHQWFGDLVTCQDWSQGWLNESWATVMEAFWWEEDRTEAEATWYRHGTAGGYFDEHARRYRRPIVSYDFREPIDVFDRHLYNKGSCVLWTLRNELGAEAFWAGVNRYLTTHGHDTVHTRHFQRAMEGATGRNLDRFFHQWIHSPGHPQLEVALKPEGDLLSVAVKQTQSGDDVPEAFELRLRLEIVFEDGSTRALDLPVRERERAWAVPVDGEIATVRVDPGFRVLAEIKIRGPQSWLARLVEDACPVLAVRAASALLEEGGPRSIDAVAEALAGHPFWGVRGSLAGAFARRGGPDALEILTEASCGEEDSRVRSALASALGSFRSAEAADALLADAERGFASTQHHGAVLEALGKTRDPRARPHLEAGLTVDGWASLVKRKALAGLAATRDPDVLGSLVDYSGPAHRGRVRSAAASALATLGDAVPDLRAKVVERLVEVVREDGFTAQLGAISALGQLRDPRGLGALSQVHASAPDGRTRRMAYEAMYHIRQGRDSEEGMQQLRDRLEKLEHANRALRDRLDKLEPVDDE